jgi:hypothetical protein
MTPWRRRRSFTDTYLPQARGTVLARDGGCDVAAGSRAGLVFEMPEASLSTALVSGAQQCLRRCVLASRRSEPGCPFGAEPSVVWWSAQWRRRSGVDPSHEPMRWTRIISSSSWQHIRSAILTCSRRRGQRVSDDQLLVSPAPRPSSWPPPGAGIASPLHAEPWPAQD